MRHGRWVLLAAALAACEHAEHPGDGPKAPARLAAVAAPLDADAAAELDRLEAAMKAAPGDHAAADRYRETARLHGATRRAITWLEALTADAAAGRLANVHYQLGMAHIDMMAQSPDVSKSASSARALECFEAAIARDPAFWDARYAKGLVYLRTPAGLKQYPKAIEVFSDLLARQAALPPQPEFALTYVRLSEAYVQGGDRQHAAAILHSGLRRFPDHPLLRAPLAALPREETRP